MKATLQSKNESVILGSSPFGLVQDVDLSGLSANHNILDIQSDGGYYINTKYGQRDVEIIGYIDVYNKTSEWIQTQKELLFRICDPKEQLTITVNDEQKEVYFYGYATSFPIFKTESESKTSNYLMFLIQVTCPDPYLYKPMTTKTFATTTPTFVFPLEMKDVTMGTKKLNLIDNIYNSGENNTPLYITFFIKGTVTNPYLLNVNTQEKIKFNCNLYQGDEVRIETGTKKGVTLTRNGVKSVFFYYLDLASVFLTLYKGDNVFRIGADSGENYMEVYIRYQERLGGV